MNKKNLVIILVAIVIAALIGLVLYFMQSNKQKDQEMQELVEMMNFEKEQLENEYVDLTNEFDGYMPNLKNDSLIKLLDSEKLKVQQLLEELRITKATNARRINELKNELATVRKVMIHYVQQIDSLNVANKRLTSENVEVRQKYRAASETVEILSKEKESLNEVVTRASIMEIGNFNVITLNRRDRKTSRLSQIATLQFNFSIAKNVTASAGKKTLYLRITRPDDVVLSKGTANVFAFEDKNIAYSAKKEVEYENEELQDVIYWKVEEMLPTGMYRADFFLDGSRIGSFAFELKK